MTMQLGPQRPYLGYDFLQERPVRLPGIDERRRSQYRADGDHTWLVPRDID